MEEKLPSFLSSPSPTPSKIPTPLTPAIFSLIWLSVQHQSNSSPPSLPSNHLRGKSCCNYILSKRAVVHLTFHNSVTGPLNGVSNLFLQPPGVISFQGFLNACQSQHLHMQRVTGTAFFSGQPLFTAFHHFLRVGELLFTKINSGATERHNCPAVLEGMVKAQVRVLV